MTTIVKLLPQFLLLAGTTAVLLGFWGRRNRLEELAHARPVSEGVFLLASFVSLFLELLLIRWVSSELRIFAYLKNFVLIACFLGFGYGAAVSRRRIQVLTPLWGCLALAGTSWYARRQPASLFVWVSEVMAEFEDVTMMGKTVWLTGADHATALALACATVAGVFLLVTLVFIPFGQVVGRYLDAAANTIRAYSLNVVASLVGIWAFTALAFFSTPPWIWFSIGSLPGAGGGGGNGGGAACAVLTAALTAVLLHEPATPSGWTIWSPYQKLRVTAWGHGGPAPTYELEVNGTWYQRAMDLSDRAQAARPEAFAGKRLRYDPYNVPFLFQPEAKGVLVVGSGMGNDVAGALRNGAGHVVAVQIDPQIFAEGSRLHPERPYSSHRVEAVVNDARNYFMHSDRRFDLIIFGLLDSHTLSSSFANIRLDNYVYTREAFEEARRLLGEGGLLVVKFEVQRPWLGRRMQEMLTAVFGQPPLVFRDEEGLGSRAIVFVAGDLDRIRSALAADPDLAGFVQDNAVAYPPAAIPAATDDWPFLYHQGRYVPTIYLIFSVLLAATAALFTRRSLAGARDGLWHFFFLGAGFLLLEVQVVSRLALFFGTTWVVNAVVLSAVLCMVLLANLAAAPLRAPGYGPAYLGLLLAILLIYLLPPDRLFLASELTKGLLVGGLFTLPLFFAGLIFIASFRAAPRKDAAFGANLLGAILGGFLEAVAFVTGMRFLLLLAAALYFLSAATLPDRRVPRPGVDTPGGFR